MLDTQAILWDNDIKPSHTIHEVFIYAGHTMTVGIFADETSNDVSWSLVSVWASPIEGGVYPANFAELEACEIIATHLKNRGPEIHPPVLNTVRDLMGAITSACVSAEFEEVR